MNGWYALIAALVGWLIAQTWKTVAGVVADRKQIKKMGLAALIGYVTRSGGMPSGHAASMSALTVCLGLGEGFGSGVFALSLAMTLIVIYDAIHVRYAVGVQGMALNRMLEKEGEKPLPIAEGHTLAQVVVGMIIGVVVGIITSAIVGILV